MAIKTESKTRDQVDKLLQKADKALTSVHYFECEALCLEAIGKAASHNFFDQIAQATLPLLEARRQKRVAAIEAGKIRVVDGDLPRPGEIEPGVYLLQPPRVGIDGRRLRDAADQCKVPVLVLVREPSTREGLVPVVVIAQRTIRIQVRGYKKLDLEWILSASEALGDTAIEMINAEASLEQQVEYLLECVHTHPDHEELHTQLADCAREASRATSEERQASVSRRQHRKKVGFLDDETEDDDDALGLDGGEDDDF